MLIARDWKSCLATLMPMAMGYVVVSSSYLQYTVPSSPYSVMMIIFYTLKDVFLSNVFHSFVVFFNMFEHFCCVVCLFQVISHEEFTTGCELLNEHLPDGQKLTEISTILSILDFDGSGEIDLNEFFEAFRILESRAMI